MVILTAGLVSAAPASAASAWNIVPSPNVGGPPSGRLAAVACPTATLCFAVGSVLGVNASEPNSLIERWNGAAWSAVVSPDPSGAKNAELNGVACADDSNCFAVGYSESTRNGSRTSMIKRWDGATWSTVAASGLLGELSAVACPSPTTCFATGGRSGSAGVVRWNGTSWSIAATPTLGFDAFLGAIACSSVSNCFAVGSDPSSPRAIVERWDGTNWSTGVAPLPPGAVSAGFGGVACTDAASCVAVGASSLGPLFEQWDGAKWTVAATSGGVTPSTSVDAVGCSSASRCFAVGSVSSSAAVVRWDGKVWAPVAVSGPGALTGVGCWSDAGCAAVGTAGFKPTVAERWDGTAWSVVSTPTPLAPWDALIGVSCRSVLSCWAVGRYDVGEVDLDVGLIERWNGTSWSAVADAPKNGGRLRRLVGVTCESANRCFAVGSENYQDFEHTMVLEHWDGARWSQITPKTPVGLRSSDLGGVACASATRCFAVGYYRVKGKDRSLVEGWDGATWSQTASPNPTNAQFAVLSDVACPGPKTCFAVGDSLVHGSPVSTLVERWNGNVWSVVPSPNPRGATSSGLVGVACTSASSCVAIGQYTTAGATRPFGEQWDGSKWTVTLGLVPGGASSAQLSNVSCAAASSCYAAGSEVANKVTKPLLEHWNGPSWSPVSVPIPTGASFSQLSGVACVGTSGCVTVGVSGAENTQSTLIERRS